MQSTHKLLNGVTTIDAIPNVHKRHSIEMNMFLRSAVANLEGPAGASATVVVEVSDDGIRYAPRLSFTLNDGNRDDCDDDEHSYFPFVRGSVKSISGGGIVHLSLAASTM